MRRQLFGATVTPVINRRRRYQTAPISFLRLRRTAKSQICSYNLTAVRLKR